ncbi:discoidin domain-containing protein [bacterium]|nr:discoidin domain-containing protein [bacterium]
MRLAVCALTLVVATASVADPNVGLVARYSFEQLTAGGIRDLSGKGNDLQAQGTLTLAPGKVGQAVRISKEGYPQAPLSPTLELGGGMTLEAWIKPEFHPPSGMRLLDRATIGGNDGFMFDTWPEGHLRLIIAPGLLRDSEQLPANEWTHVAATYSDELGEARLYRNGQVVAEAVCAGKLKASTHPLNLGASQGGGDRFMGLMDEVRVYSRALAPEEIMAHFQGKEIEPPALAQTVLPSQPAIIRSGKVDVDYAAQCARNDLVYLSPAVYPFEAMHIGNGNLGACLWNERGLTWQLNNGSYRHGIEPVSSGKVTLSCPALTQQPARFEQRQRLWDGLVTTTLDGPSGAASATSLVVEGEDCLVSRLKLPAGQEATLELHLWPARTKAKLVSGPDFVALTEHVDNADPLLADSMALLVRVDGAAVRAAQQDERTLTLTFTAPAAGLTLYVANPMLRGDEAQALQRAQASIAHLQGQGYAKTLADHAAFWHGFWPRSFVHLTSRHGEAEFLENLWYLYQYDMASMSRHTLCPKFNGGNWLVYEDMRHWGGGYWHQNTREVFWPLYSSNHIALSDPFFELYRGVMKNARENGRVGLGVDGFYIPEWIPVNGGGPLRGRKDFSKPGYTAFIFTVGLEVALQGWWRYEFSGDEQFLRDMVYPLLKGSLDFYANYARQGPDGKLHLEPADAQESYWLVKDPAQDLAALRWALPLALRLSTKLGVDADMRPRWQNLLDNLAPFAVEADKHMLKEADLPPDAERHNSENVANYAIYPFGIFGIGLPDHDLAVNTFRNRPVQGMGNGWEPAAIAAARLGLADEAAKLALAHMAANMRSNNGGWYSPTTAVFAGNIPDSPYYDAAGVCAQTLNEMLLQSQGGLIRLAPAWPARWQSQFRLRARGGFMVTVDLHEGQVRYALIEGERGGTCRLANPWPDRAIVTCAGKPVAAGTGPELVFPTAAGKTYLLERAIQRLAKFPAGRLSPVAASGPRSMGRLAAYPQWTGPYLGLDPQGRSPQRAMMRRAVQAAEARLAAATKGLRVVGQMRPPAPIPNGKDVTLDLGGPATVSAVVFSRDRTGLFVDQPVVGYVIEVSAEGQQWQAVVERPKSGAAPAGETVTFAPTSARFVRLRTWGAYSGPARVEEITVYGP